MAPKKHILFISYYFPPVGTIGTLRNYNMARQLAKHFDQTHLITIKNKPLLLGDDLDLDFLSVHEVSNFDYRNLSNLFSKKKQNDKISTKQHKKSFGFIRKMLDSYPFNVLFGEGGEIYILFALLKAIRIIKKHKITHIYSSFRPFADHYIAHRLKKRFPQLVWIVDFRDLPVDENRNNVLFKNYQDRVYKRIFSKADIVCTVSEGLKKRISSYNDNTLVVKSGLQTLFVPEQIQGPEQFTITYTGSLYPNHQKPQLLLSALKKMLNEGIIEPDKLNLIYAGKDAELWRSYIQEFKLESIANTLGLLSLSQSIKLQHESHINLLLSWSGPHTGGVLTGKLFEYLAAKRPVLCLINGAEDKEIEDLFDKLNAGKVFYLNEEEIVTEWILNYYREWLRAGEINHTMDEGELKKLSWHETVKPLMNELAL